MSEPSLFLVKSPMLEESPTSWLIRTAALHGVSVRELLRAVGIRRQRRDVDFFFHRRFLERVVRGTGITLTTIAQPANFFESFRKERWLTPWLRVTEDGRPCTAYCPACLENDLIPFWRAVWRFRYWVVCPKHACYIVERCQGCGSEITFDKELSAVQGRRGLQHWLKCSHCGYSRTAGTEVQPFSLFPEVMQDVAALQRTVTSALLHGRLFLAGFSGAIPLAFLPGLLAAGAVSSSDSTLPLDVRHQKELARAIRRQARTGGRAFIPCAEPRDMVGSSRVPWAGDAFELAHQALHSRFLEPVERRA